MTTQLSSRRITFTRIFACTLIIAAGLVSGKLFASSELQTHQSILSKVNAALTQHLQAGGHKEFRVQPGKLDPRMAIKRCDIPLETYIVQGNQRSRSVTVTVRCNGIHAWKIYIPSQVYIYKKVLVPRRTLARGDVVTADAVQLARFETSNLHYGYYLKKADIVGKQVKRTIMPGNVIRPQLLQDPILVKRGETVTIVAEVSGIRVSMTGKALSSGSIGKTIKVRNLSSKKIVEATIVSKGLVKVVLKNFKKTPICD